MRPVKLEMTAFGPFAETEIIDFESLGEHPLFLINGPTGSGKTTILDGICFALYGATTGNERDAEQMRCDAAGEDLITRVVLVFELHRQHYRISREPRQLRPKARGEGYTTQSPCAELLKLSETGKARVMVASKVMEATREIENLIGLNVDQFRQVMVLPQGEFRNLLMADSRKREQIFSELFQTQVYRRIEDLLKSQSSQIRAERTACYERQQGMLQAVEMQSEEMLLQTLVSQQQAFKTAADGKQAAIRSRDRANTEFLEAQKIQQAYRNLANIEQRLEALQGRSPAIQAQAERLKCLQIALQLQPGYTACKEAVAEHERTLKAVQKQQQNLQAQGQTLASALATVDAAKRRKPELENLKLKQHRLQAFQPRISTLDDARDGLHWAEQALASKTERYDQGKLTLEGVQRGCESARNRHKQLLERLKDLPDHQLKLQGLEAILRRFELAYGMQQQIEECSHEIYTHESLLTSAQDAVLRVKESVTRLTIAWHSAQAALLAQTLEPGFPCPVCGSEQHPAPVVSTTDIPDEKARQQADDNLDRARAHRNQVKLDLTALQSRRAQLIKGLSAEGMDAHAVSADALQSQHVKRAQQQEYVAMLEAEVSNERELQARLLKLESLSLEQQAEIEQLGQRLVDFKTQCDIARSQVEAAENELPEAYREASVLAAHLVQTSRDIDAIEQALVQSQQDYVAGQLAETAERVTLEGLQEAALHSQAQASEKKSAWQSALDQSGFADEEAYLAVIGDVLKIPAIQTVIRNHDKTLDELNGELKAQQLALKNSPRPDIDKHQAGLERCKTMFEQAEQVHAALSEAVSHLDNTRQKLLLAQQEAASIDAKYAIIGTLSDAANGRTGRRISLQRFVLSVLLDDVLLEASQRLKQMSKGRYALYRQQEKTKGGAASGLELVVEDAYYGTQRPVATLSGGESFMAALALALGLSDVVQAHAGGIRLDTLFIDEGFGSLDPESLDLAIRTLTDLQASGRMVGVISHVPELKEVINVRLDVMPDRGGSHTRVVAG